MVKVIIARCDEHDCNQIAGEWVYKKGDALDNKDYCVEHRENEL